MTESLVDALFAAGRSFLAGLPALWVAWLTHRASRRASAQTAEQSRLEAGARDKAADRDAFSDELTHFQATAQRERQAADGLRAQKRAILAEVDRWARSLRAWFMSLPDDVVAEVEPPPSAPDLSDLATDPGYREDG